MLDNWHRLERVIKWTGLSVNSFALSIGLKRSENLYQIKKGNNRISRELASLITNKYPSISKGWLLLGEGDMFIHQNNFELTKAGVPYYAIDAVMAVENGAGSETPAYYINAQPINDCDIAGLVSGTAMQPDIPAGSIVILKKVTVKEITPGESYLIITPYFKGIRVIRMSQHSSEYLLLPRNTQDYDPITIERNSINKLYLVKGLFITKNL